MLRAVQQRRVAGKIIDFLAQLEDFQKKLWLKKKFVVETRYCITLDRIPVEFYPEIAANDTQRQEWVKLFAIDEIEGNLATPGYSKKLSPEFLEKYRRCCTALAESEIRLWWWPRYVSSMKYPKRCQYKHAKQKKYHVRNWAEYNEGLRRRGDLTVWFDEEAIAN